MALVYLSPSGQTDKSCASSGSEALDMNRIADEMEPWFRASGISFARSGPEMTAAQRIEAVNQGQYALHLALHAVPASEAPENIHPGVAVFYSARSRDGRVAAELIANNLREIYPDPKAVQALPTDNIGEVIKVYLPAAFIQFAYHAPWRDGAWTGQNIALLAEAVARAVAEYFGLPCLLPQPVETGVADLPFGVLNIRTGPSQVFPVLAQVQDGGQLTIHNRYRNWFVVAWNGISGYALQDYITVDTTGL